MHFVHVMCMSMKSKWNYECGITFVDYVLQPYTHSA